MLRVRYTGVGIGYHFAQAIFGGTAAVLATLASEIELPGILAGTGPGFYLVAIGIIALTTQIVGWCCMAKPTATDDTGDSADAVASRSGNNLSI